MTTVLFRFCFWCSPASLRPTWWWVRAYPCAPLLRRRQRGGKGDIRRGQDVGSHSFTWVGGFKQFWFSSIIGMILAICHFNLRVAVHLSQIEINHDNPIWFQEVSAVYLSSTILLGMASFPGRSIVDCFWQTVTWNRSMATCFRAFGGWHLRHRPSGMSSCIPLWYMKMAIENHIFLFGNPRKPAISMVSSLPC